jgi:eukaryotic-like serine/threonine-protein kinase
MKPDRQSGIRQVLDGPCLPVPNGRADRDEPLDFPGQGSDRTEVWHLPLGESGLQRGPAAIDCFGAGSVAGSSFSPRPAIASGSRPHSASADESAARARLRALPLVYALVVAMATVWRCAVLREADPALHYLDASVIAALVGAFALLSARRPVSPSRLRGLEAGMVGLVAGRIAVVQYRLMLEFSLRGDPVMAQLIMKNVVLLTSVVVLTCGLHVPKTWRMAVLTTVPLALLPFATLLALYLGHPEAMAWLVQAPGSGEAPPILQFSFDAMTLLILVSVCGFGAHAISRLRRQVVEARQVGKYRLRRRIGAGAMGEVYLAEHQLLKRPCALKLIRPDRMGDPRAVGRFEREVRATAALSHPNTVEVYDYGRTPDGTYYFVMEYLPGLSLAELVERHGPVPPGRAVYLLRQVCGALGEAHAAGLIHRDIKPSNVVAARRGGQDDVAKLLDFGLVRPAATPSAAGLSAEGQVVGTPLYMSPEQAGGREVDGRSDIYSLGAVAYHLLTGRPPFGGEERMAVLIAHARDPVVPPSQVLAGVPADVERVVLRCLAKDPAERFADAGSLERALGQCACSEEWDQGRAAGWWRDAGRMATLFATTT